MSLNDRFVIILALSVALIAVGSLGFSWGTKYFTNYQASQSLETCRQFSTNEEQIDCIFRFIDGAIEKGDLAGGLRFFAAAYRDFTSFSGTGCHRHAHRVGDSVYYRYYVLGHDDLDALTFPQETTACGYGLFHGFLEHLIQDNPNPVFTMDVCETLEKNLARTMGDIRVICYHGAGHGYTLANAEPIPQSKWGDVPLFTEQPLAQCEKMTRATENEKEDCRQGVFNVLVDWMEVGNYGFSYDPWNPFEACRYTASRYQHACYYEMSQKISAISLNPIDIYSVAKTAPTKELADLAFFVGTGGIIQSTIIDGNGYSDVLENCNSLPDDAFHICVESTVWGLYEHGEPQEEYKRVLDFCKEPVITERGEADFCFEKAIDRLPRFYSASRITSICKEFPEAYTSQCEGKAP